MMWLFFGIGAIILAGANVLFTLRQKDAKWFRFCSLSCTALTICAFYQDAAHWVIIEDWSALMDILPSVSRMLWICVIASIVINSISLLVKRTDKVQQ